MIRKLSILILALIMSAGAIASSKRKIEDDIGPDAKRVSPVELPYMYPDEQPRSKHVFTLDFSAQEWKYGGKNSDMRILQVYDNIAQILGNEGFLLTPSCSSLKPNKTITIFGRYVQGKLRESLIVACEYRVGSLSPFFEKVEFMVDSRIKRPFEEKWDIQHKEDEPSIREPVSCTDFTWKWADSAIHYINRDIDSYDQFIDPNKGKLTKHIYKTIKKNGLENTLMRISVVANNNSLYSFNIMYNNVDEEAKGTRFLLDLKEALYGKFVFI